MAAQFNKITIKQGNDGQFYWHFQTRNGKITCNGGEGYVTAAGAVRAAKKIIEEMKKNVTITDLTHEAG